MRCLHHTTTTTTMVYQINLLTTATAQVHRLDHSTTGVVLYAKSPARRDHLKQLFAQRKVEKTYLAITNGVPR